MTYQVALFCQYFNHELAWGDRRLRPVIRRSVRRLSPDIDDRELRTYTDALYATMTTENGALRPDWRQRVEENH